MRTITFKFSNDDTKPTHSCYFQNMYFYVTLNISNLCFFCLSFLFINIYIIVLQRLNTIISKKETIVLADKIFNGLAKIKTVTSTKSNVINQSSVIEEEAQPIHTNVEQSDCKRNDFSSRKNIDAQEYDDILTRHTNLRMMAKEPYFISILLNGIRLQIGQSCFNVQNEDQSKDYSQKFCKLYNYNNPDKAKSMLKKRMPRCDHGYMYIQGKHASKSTTAKPDPTADYVSIFKRIILSRSLLKILVTFNTTIHCNQVNDFKDEKEISNIELNKKLLNSEEIQMDIDESEFFFNKEKM
ncbi:hypothetical protein RFI_03928 [Reticulomyxa filosa]|uniref:Uncharacterized protein n=1 Tax=Reticulomyxa filosa TaxID=46433 RepID=X6P515_RETFI|nr:hypothetical protein RFI_03928 [Reticulomyxa filosa]|eukprot:ETO33179.1 hypothetical protein RFI_03928 [Reticulomyxa filosa]